MVFLFSWCFIFLSFSSCLNEYDDGIFTGIHLLSNCRYCEERPLSLSNAGMGANLRTYYQKLSPSDQTGILLRNEKSSLGNVVILEQTDKSPFLGDIKAGCRQSSLETNMYKAPLFPHKVPPTDYLLVRSAKGKLSIRRIDRVAVVGQQV
jgi:transcription initiation factor TFIID subunit 1